ncbi:hypothetical protein [Burkholderia guangdongensis]|uniref:hypothetical protein n=1 Tax=Burkholderia guangdongensis TaxID=1792500 RepID=UPI0015CEA5E8|nr:hypothetical protein [Burkholderia guangdongensis]
MQSRFIRILVGAALLAALALVVAFNVINLSEAYGNGAPYYGRTTNMDKWTDPRPILAVVDAVMLAALGAFAYWARRRR